MKPLLTKESFVYTDIQLLIDSQIEESVTLEFKSAAALSMGAKEKVELAKDVSAFANAAGGVIIYGLVEVDHVAHHLDFVDGRVITKERIEQVLQSSIQRPIPDLRIHAIRYDDDLSKSIYVIQIPQSSEAPHMSKDNRYYKRHNFTVARMEEYEVRNALLSKRQSRLLLEGSRLSVKEVDDLEDGEYIHRIEIVHEINVANVGDIPERDYVVNLYLKGNISDFIVSWDRRYDGMDHTYLDTEVERRMKLTNPSNRTLYPSETVTAMRISLKLNLSTAATVLAGISSEVALFYPYGEDKMDVVYDEWLFKAIDEIVQRIPDLR